MNKGETKKVMTECKNIDNYTVEVECPWCNYKWIDNEAYCIPEDIETECLKCGKPIWYKRIIKTIIVAKKSK